MKELTDNEKAYLQLAYDKGYRWIATDRSKETFFFKDKPVKADRQWMTKISDVHDIFESMIDFGATWEDEEPTKIADLLGIDETDWSKVKPFTPVLVRDEEPNKILDLLESNEEG